MPYGDQDGAKGSQSAKSCRFRSAVEGSITEPRLRVRTFRPTGQELVVIFGSVAWIAAIS